MAVSSFNIPEGLALSYSSPLIPQLSKEDSDVKITLQQGVLLGKDLFRVLAPSFENRRLATMVLFQGA